MKSSALSPEIFKAYDIRGIVHKTLTPHTVHQIGMAIGSEALERGEKTIVVGRDGRLSGPELVDVLTEGLASTGCNVIDVGMVPTPLLYFATYELGTGSGVAVTGSHNPPDYNGLKMMLGGETLAGNAIQSLRQRVLDGNLLSGRGAVSQSSVLDAYLNRLTSDIKLNRPLKIVIDCGNGVAGVIAPALFKKIGCDVIELFCDVDGQFPNHHPDPSQLENLTDLINGVRQHNADIGLAFDGDGDRLGVITPAGEIIWPDRQLLLFAKDLLDVQPGAEIIYDVKCTRLLPEAIKEAGGRPLMWKTGHSFIKAKLKETRAALAGEMSGHLFFNERWYGFDDGLYAGARMCELVSRHPQDPQSLFDTIPNSVNTPELRMEMDEGEHYTLIEELVDKADFDDGDVSNIDGLRVDFEFGFGLIRASNTTPMLIMRFEANHQEGLKIIQDRFRALINSVRPGLAIPF